MLSNYDKNMTDRKLTAEILNSEILFTSSRSSGPGGQNVNKVNSKVTLHFDLRNSRLLTDDERAMLMKKWEGKLTTEAVLLISAQDKRSQIQNKEEVIEKFNALLVKAFQKRKARKNTKPTKSSVQKRIQSKKKDGEKKKWRKRPE
jgi:ribosome-associated protein